MKNKRITVVLTAFCLCMAGTGIPEGCFEIYENITVNAEAEVKIVDSGKCGDNLTWKLDSNGTFTIEGTGAKAFQGCTSLVEVTVSDRIEAISADAFKGCNDPLITVSCTVRSLIEKLIDVKLNLKHNYSEYFTEAALCRKATCTEPSLYYPSCSECGENDKDETRTFEGTKYGHKMINDAENGSHKCIRGDILSEDHSFSDEGICICGIHSIKINTEAEKNFVIIPDRLF